MIKNKATSAPFLRLYALTLLFFSANSILNVIIPLQSKSIGASNGEIGLIMGVYMFTCMFFRPMAGFLVQKQGASTVLKRLVLVNGLALIMYTFTGLFGYLTARIIQGICTALFSMALQMGIIDALPEDERSQGISLYSLFTYLPTIAGPLIAIGIWDWGGLNSFSIIIITIAVATGLFGYYVSRQAVAVQAEESSVDMPSFIQTCKQFSSQRPLVICSMLMLILSTIFGTVTTFLPLYAQQIELGHAGLFLMLQAATIVFMRFAFSKRIPSDGQWHPTFIATICLLGILGSLLLAVSRDWGALAFYPAALFIGMAQALMYPTLISYLTFVLPRSLRNVLISLFIATADLGIAIGGIAMGPIADYFSYAIMYAVSTLLAVAALIITVATVNLKQWKPDTDA